MSGRRGTTRRGSGFRALQFLVVAAVVAVVAGVGLPVYAARAKDVVLSQNMHTLETVVKCQLELTADGQPVAGAGIGSAGNETLVSSALLTALRDGNLPGRGFVNPLSGSSAVVFRSGQASTAVCMRPAVLIALDDGAAGEAFRGAGTHEELAGTIVVLVLEQGGPGLSVAIFVVDRDGHRSADVVMLAT